MVGHGTSWHVVVCSLHTLASQSDVHPSSGIVALLAGSPKSRVSRKSGQEFGVGLDIRKCSETGLRIVPPGVQAPVPRGIFKMPRNLRWLVV